ncbi:MAG: S8 family serine peptidase [Bacteroidota bacterium]
MKKAIFVYAALLLFCLYEPVYPKAKLSPSAKKIESELSAKVDSDNLSHKNFLKRIQNQDYINTLIKINKDFNFKTAELNGVHFGTIAGNICTAQIPLANYLRFIEQNGLEYVEFEAIAVPFLDSAVSMSNIKQIQQGIQPLIHPYTGIGVIAGIVDFGFDYTHPAFYDTLNKERRIKRVWELQSKGTPPNDFSYGRELTSEAEILGKKRDTSIVNHGSHVAGIVAGQDWPTGGLYGGVAQGADIVMSALKTSQSSGTSTNDLSALISDVVDGISYIFKYADSVGKPCVINLSWGTTLGPKDGTSLFSQAVENMVGPGRILCVSAANSGDYKCHAKFKFTQTDTVLKTNFFNYTQFGPYKFAFKTGSFEIWGDSLKTFKLNISILDTGTKAILGETGFFDNSKDSNYVYKTYINDDSVTITVNCIAKEYNNETHFYITLKSKTGEIYQYSISAEAKDATMHFYNTGLIEFTNAQNPTAVDGDNLYTLNDWCSSPNIISVGAYVSKKTFRNTGGISVTSYPMYTIGDIAGFSSRGPAASELNKPDISAPGCVLVSAFNSYYTASSSTSTQVAKVNYKGRNYPYVAMSGTSMSSPMVTGTVALLLEANPTLTPKQVIDYFRKNAIVDSYTGTVPNPIWGWGKMNAFATIKDILGFSDVNEEENYSKGTLFPNPADDAIGLNFSGSGPAEAFIFNSLGQLKLRNEIDLSGSPVIPVSSLQNGMYFVIIRQGNKILYRDKFVVGR